MNNLLFHDPDLLDVLITEFFFLRETEETHPTVPGLALFIGFRSTADIVQTLDQWEDDEFGYPRRSIDLLISAITRIEDYYLCKGMDSKVPAALSKFVLGAYHNIKEPSRNIDQPNNAIQIVFEGNDDPKSIMQLASSNHKQIANNGNKIGNDDILIEME